MKRFIQLFSVFFLGLVVLSPLLAFARDEFDPDDANSGVGSFGGGSEMVLVDYGDRNVNTLQDLVQVIINFINYYLVPLLVSMALFWFLYGLVEYVRNVGDAKSRDDGRWKMVYGIIGLAVMVSVWGLVNVVRDTFNFNYRQPEIPKFRSSSLSTPSDGQV